MSENDIGFDQALRDQRRKNARAIRRIASDIREQFEDITIEETIQFHDEGQSSAVSRSVEVLMDDRLLHHDHIAGLKESVIKDSTLIVTAMDELHPKDEDEDRSEGEAEREDGNREEELLAASIAATSDMLSEITALKSQLFNITGSVRGRVSNAVNTVANWLQHLEQTIRNNIGNKLWNLVSSYVNLDSWSVSGDAGVNLLGLQGNVGIQLNFTN